MGNGDNGEAGRLDVGQGRCEGTRAIEAARTDGKEGGGQEAGRSARKAKVGSPVHPAARARRRAKEQASWATTTGVSRPRGETRRKWGDDAEGTMEMEVEMEVKMEMEMEMGRASSANLRGGPACQHSCERRRDTRKTWPSGQAPDPPAHEHSATP
ncbi:hypothetical protein Dda_9417 [Drechslerella dactyloides]|uniref:Uncharacterized protein n=1 Tax=Drechslerella dactyloides TaxID=74499 RepID=A0AAD6ISX2_DREDA|nr:hypothetical protein Dda_9417 [Drechslerella dactyloides]